MTRIVVSRNNQSVFTNFILTLLTAAIVGGVATIWQMTNSLAELKGEFAGLKTMVLMHLKYHSEEGKELAKGHQTQPTHEQP